MNDQEKLKLKRLKDWICKFDHTYQTIPGAPHGHVVHSTCTAILSEFHNEFPDDTISIEHVSPMNARALYEKHGNKDAMACPICSAALIVRRAKKTNDQFRGCSKFPQCRGTRDKKGNPTFSKELIVHLVALANKNETQKNLGRFADL